MVRNMTWELVGSVKRIASEKENRMSIHEVLGRGDWVTDVDSKVPDTAGQRSKMLHKVSFARISSITQNNSVVATAGLGSKMGNGEAGKIEMDLTAIAVVDPVSSATMSNKIGSPDTHHGCC
ncbi:uncharacterized protein [Physcomitrium patens]|uniref:Uncharacterized protein n=1 Tax=Physcomitrium patens TaxID=3218 RepID=A9THU3_PHYPA|nr:hypothetical protein PHYPA_029463 [Physcomitrium patens]